MEPITYELDLSDKENPGVWFANWVQTYPHFISLTWFDRKYEQCPCNNCLPKARQQVEAFEAAKKALQRMGII